MGLDISYYGGATRLRGLSDDGEYDYEGGEFAVHPSPDFLSHADDLTAGIYTGVGSGGFHAGSYSTYNLWREDLAVMAGYPAVGADRFPHSRSAWEGRTGPFSELINFTDCDGVIGPRTAAKLARDFQDHQGKADGHAGDWFRTKYAEFRKAFEVAAAAGVVIFH